MIPFPIQTCDNLLLQQSGPTHWQDVNSHNILIDGAPEHADETYLAQNASFWLIDFGLAVDSQSWVPALFASARGSSKTQIDFWLVRLVEITSGLRISCTIWVVEHELYFLALLICDANLFLFLGEFLC